MVDITKRSVKGSPLTNDEVDDNFDNLNTGKVGVEDIGTDPNQVPLNQYLGSMAYQDLDAVSITGGTATLDSADINGGTIDGATIGGSSAGAITGTTGQFNTSLNVDGTVTADGADLDGAVVINESGADVDFRVESDNESHALFVDAGNDTVLVNTSTAADSDVDLQVNSLLALGTGNSGLTKIFNKNLPLSDNVSATFLTINLPAMGNFTHNANIGIEISYLAYANRQTSARESRSTYGKVYLAIDRHWQDSTDAPVAITLVDTDKELANSSGTFTITWAASVTAGGTDQSAKTIEVTVLVDNPKPNLINQGVIGTVTAHIIGNPAGVILS